MMSSRRAVNRTERHHVNQEMHLLRREVENNTPPSVGGNSEPHAECVEVISDRSVRTFTKRLKKLETTMHDLFSKNARDIDTLFVTVDNVSSAVAASKPSQSFDDLVGWTRQLNASADANAADIIAVRKDIEQLRIAQNAVRGPFTNDCTGRVSVQLDLFTFTLGNITKALWALGEGPSGGAGEGKMRFCRECGVEFLKSHSCSITRSRSWAGPFPGGQR